MAISTIEEALRYSILADNSVRAITTRCYAAELPQNPVFPLILFFRVTGASDVHLGGVSGIAHVRFQIEAWAETYAAAKELARAIRGAINTKIFRVDSVSLNSIVIQSERDYYEPDVGTHRIIADYMVWGTEN